MRIVTLVENSTDRPALLAEHGLSFYIETGNKKILFDCGQTDVFLKNARSLGISIAEVDALILSHGHYDHTGGLKYFLKENNQAVVYLKKEALLKKYNGDRYIGTDASLLKETGRIHYVNKLTELTPGLFIVPDIKIHYPSDVHFNKMSLMNNDILTPDTFEDELFLSVINDGKITIISSCSHRGITNIVQNGIDMFRLPVQTVIGGFHLKHSKVTDVEEIAAYFNKMSIASIGVCHCTGIENYVILKNKCRGRVFYNQTGRETHL